LAVSIDGARQPGNVWHHNGNLTLDPMFLKSVEVDPGVTAADAGFGAAAGAIRYETVDAIDLLKSGKNLGGTAILGYDSNGQTFKTTLSGYGKSDKGIDFLGMVSSANGEDYEGGDGEEQRGTEADLLSGMIKLAYESENGHRFAYSSDYSKDDAERLLRLNLGPIRGTYQFNETKATRWTNTFRYTSTRPTGAFDPEILVYTNQTDLRRPKSWTRPSGDFNSDVDSIGGKAQNTFTLDNGTITAGLDAYHNEINIERFYDTSLTGLPMANLAEEESLGAGLYVQARIDTTDRLALSGGLRVDYQDFDSVDDQEFTDSGFSPNLTIEYNLGQGFGILAGYSYNWLGLEQGEPALYHARDFIYDEGLDSAHAENYKLGLTYKQSALNASITYFDTTLTNPVMYDYTLNTGYGIRINGEDINSKGVDLALNYSWDTGRAGIKYTYTDVTYDDNLASPGLYVVVPVGNILTLSIDQALPSYNLKVGGDLQYAQTFDDKEFLAQGFLAMDNYTVVNTYADWTPASVDGLTFRLEVNNIFDEDYANRGTYPNTAFIQETLSPGRSFALTAKYNF